MDRAGGGRCHRPGMGGFTRLEERRYEIMRKSASKLVCLLWAVWYGFAATAFSQAAQEEPTPGPDSHETGQGPHGHLLGHWGGERTRLEQRGVKFDFQYVSDSLRNIKGEHQERFASWNRFRGTVDIDLGTLVGEQGLYFHATALWQGGGNLGAYLGLLTSPSGMSSANTCRLDSWWIEKRWVDGRITARVGQVAGSISMEPSTTRLLSSSSRWAMRWAICSQTWSPSTHPQRQRWKFESLPPTTFT